LSFQEQYYVPLRFENEVIGKYFLDFLIEGCIILELKRDQFIPAHIIYQTKQYLMTLNLSLALIACFTHKGVFIKRIINQTNIPIS
jgi:GxxExxY protein